MGMLTSGVKLDPEGAAVPKAQDDPAGHTGIGGST
jgi:hypothetical protein